MMKALVLLGGILFFKVALPRRPRSGRQRPYWTGLDIGIPHDIACTLLIDPELAANADAARGSPESGKGSAMLGA